MGKYTQFRADYVPSTKHHGPYITTQFGSTMCDFYVMSQPHLPSTAAGGPSKPIHFLGEEADGNAARFVACWNAMTGIEDPAAFMAEVREFLQRVERQAYGDGGGEFVEPARALLAKMEGQ